MYKHHNTLWSYNTLLPRVRYSELTLFPHLLFLFAPKSFVWHTYPSSSPTLSQICLQNKSDWMHTQDTAFIKRLRHRKVYFCTLHELSTMGHNYQYHTLPFLSLTIDVLAVLWEESAPWWICPNTKYHWPTPLLSHNPSYNSKVLKKPDNINTSP